MPDISQHRVNSARAIDARERTRAEIFSQLLAMMPEDRAKQPTELFARLTPDQLLTLLGAEPPFAIASDAEPIRTTPTTRTSWRFSWSALWLPPVVLAYCFGIAVSILAGLGALTAFALAPTLISLNQTIRPQRADHWPDCPRLTPATDGCLYHVQSRLTWDSAAIQLDMPMGTLKAPNTHLARVQQLTAGTTIIVWRGTGSLQD